MATNTTDPEKGIVAATSHSWTPSAADSANVNMNINESTNYTPLQLFQLLVGIKTPSFLASDDINNGTAQTKSGRPARSENVGLYQRAKDQARTSKYKYLATSYISNILYIFQILLAATFTALSAYKGAHPDVLTVLGALNTVVAGCLAWQKGQGIPQRYRKAQDQYQALVLDIEMTERSFVGLDNNTANTGNTTGTNSNHPRPDPRVERDRLQHLYETARADQQANYPDLYVSTGLPGAKSTMPTIDLTKQMEALNAESAKVSGALMEKIEALIWRLEGKAEDAIETRVQGALTKGGLKVQ